MIAARSHALLKQSQDGAQNSMQLVTSALCVAWSPTRRAICHKSSIAAPVRLNKKASSEVTARMNKNSEELAEKKEDSIMCIYNSMPTLQTEKVQRRTRKSRKEKSPSNCRCNYER